MKWRQSHKSIFEQKKNGEWSRRASLHCAVRHNFTSSLGASRSSLNNRYTLLVKSLPVVACEDISLRSFACHSVICGADEDRWSFLPSGVLIVFTFLLRFAYTEASRYIVRAGLDGLCDFVCTWNLCKIVKKIPRQCELAGDWFWWGFFFHNILSELGNRRVEISSLSAPVQDYRIMLRKLSYNYSLNCNPWIPSVIQFIRRKFRRE